MITLKAGRVDYQNHNTPVLYDREIEEFAHAVLEDYKPQLLREPGALNFQLFLESYLDVTLIFKDIYNEDPQTPIFGVVAFRDGTLKIFDREHERVSNMIVRKNTVVIDNYVMESGREGLAAFTGFHEAGHFLIHQEVYRTAYKNQVVLEEDKVSGMVFCRRNAIEHRETAFFGERTAKQWREHQADCFAASIAMPNATFIPFVNEYLRENGIYKRYITVGEDDDLDLLASELLPEYISEVYGVSKRAASIKLKKSGFISSM
ncbi:MAG: ImmA/IrrE family metallo-endopeptidase [Oscillospiraceae bacterium]|nr:ImmA/IrrE family metallo-endopeptidase [Oscillospiraceae bacterium]